MKTVLTGGAFDILHWGHVLFLQQCKEQGDYLIVNVNSDARIRQKKGSTRPILSEDERMAIVNALECVDEVMCYPGPDYPDFDLIADVSPDVFVINSDEFADVSKERQYCETRGIEFVAVPRIISPSGMCTTRIVESIIDRGKR